MANGSFITTREKLVLIFQKILKYINNYLVNPNDSKYEKSIDTFIKQIHIFASPININEHTGEEENIFTLTNDDSDGNNLLSYCCKKNIPRLCNYIIDYYGDTFDIGAINHAKETALIISIQNNMFDVANNLISCSYADDYTEPNIGQIDNNNKNALDYMLEKVKVDENDKIREDENAIIIDNKDLVADLFKFYLDSLKYREIRIGSITEYGTIHEDGIVENYIEIFCKDFDFWKKVFEDNLLLSGKHKNIVKFNKKFCKEKKTAEATINTGKIFTGRKRKANAELPNASVFFAQPIGYVGRNNYDVYNNQPYEIIPLRHIDAHKDDYGDDYAERNPIPSRNLPVYFPPSKNNTKRKRVDSPDRKSKSPKNRDPNIEKEFSLGGKKSRSKKTRKNRKRRNSKKNRK
jgi:hypothetical protein